MCNCDWNNAAGRFRVGLVFTETNFVKMLYSEFECNYNNVNLCSDNGQNLIL